MNFYISDLHFGHANVIKLDQRPFTDVEEMNRCMIERWNLKVSEEDDVFIIGDFCYRSEQTPDRYLRQLKGHKHLIVGNHDKITLDCTNASRYFESIDEMGYVMDGEKQICLCHYPMIEWYASRRGSWLIYGHIHGSKGEEYQLMKTREHALNAAACINNYEPSTLEELIRNNAIFQNQNPAGDVLFVAKNKETGEQFVFSCEDIGGNFEIRPARTRDRTLPRNKNAGGIFENKQ